MSARPWWTGAVGYEVYVRSFADSDGDGIGDLPGIIGRLDHLAELGVDLVWVTPFYPSPIRDHGYDVADYRDVDPLFGTLGDVDRLVRACHERGLRIIVDLVANHTSSDHLWFQAARSSRDDPHRDLYIWRDPAPDGGPPNNWVSAFGGPAWTLDEGSGQYWLHLFLPEQPDLNWSNPAVADAFDEILVFWLEHGVDGFRIDVAHAFVKDDQFRDNPLVAERPPSDATARATYEAYQHVYDIDQPGVLDVFRRWRAIADRYDALLLGEVYLLDATRVARYVREQDGLHLALYIPVVRSRWDAAVLRELIARGVEQGDGHLAWALSSHDDPRAPSRFGGGQRGRDRALALLTLLMALPGLPFLYQGDELGLEDVALDPEHAQDPAAVRGGAPAGGRDRVRTPMPWDARGPNHGFTTGDPWLPLGRTPEESVAAQQADCGSHLQRTRALIRARHRLTPEPGAALAWLEAPDDAVAFQRGQVVAAANCGDQPVDVRLPGTGTVVFATDDRPTARVDLLELPPDQAVIVEVTS